MYTCSYYTNLWDPLVSLFLDSGGALGQILHEATGHLCRSCALDDDRRWRTSRHLRFLDSENVQLKHVETEFDAYAMLPKECTIFLSILTSWFLNGLTHQQNVQSILLFDWTHCRFQFYAFTAILELWIKGVLPEWNASFLSDAVPTSKLHL